MAEDDQQRTDDERESEEKRQALIATQPEQKNLCITPGKHTIVTKTFFFPNAEAMEEEIGQHILGDCRQIVLLDPHTRAPLNVLFSQIFDQITRQWIIQGNRDVDYNLTIIRRSIANSILFIERGITQSYFYSNPLHPDEYILVWLFK